MNPFSLDLLTTHLIGKLSYGDDYKFPAHLRAIDAAAQKLINSPNINRLMIRVPVRHGKSMFCCNTFACQQILKYPDRRIILATHTYGFSSDWTGRCRDFVRKFGGLTGIEVDPDFAGRGWWKVLGRRGEMRAVGAGTAAAGASADLLIVDDLVADDESANSPVQRAKLETWFEAELMTRLEPGAKVLFLMSSRHPQDLSSTQLSKNPDLPPERQWNLIRFPAISYDDDNKPHALWPERFSLEVLEQKRHELEMMGKGYLFESLYQNDPTSDPTMVEWPPEYFEGIMYDELPANFSPRLKVMTLDPSMGKESKPGDFSALLYGLYDHDGCLWIDDAELTRVPVDKVEDAAVAMWIRHKPDAFLGEANGFQQLVLDNILRKANEKGHRLNLFGHTSIENKVVRIRLNLTAMLAQKRLKLRNTMSNRLGLQQLKSFPSADHDDFPDSISLMVTLLADLLA